MTGKALPFRTLNSWRQENKSSLRPRSMASVTWHRCPSANAQLSDHAAKVEGTPIRKRNSAISARIQENWSPMSTRAVILPILCSSTYHSRGSMGAAATLFSSLRTIARMPTDHRPPARFSATAFDDGVACNLPCGTTILALQWKKRAGPERGAHLGLCISVPGDCNR